MLVGDFYLFRMARLLFFPVSLLGGVGVAIVAIRHSSLLLGLMAAFFVYWASTYVVPRLMPVDVSRYEVMTREWLAELLRDGRPGMRPDHLQRS